MAYDPLKVVLNKKLGTQLSEDNPDDEAAALPRGAQQGTITIMCPKCLGWYFLGGQCSCPESRD